MYCLKLNWYCKGLNITEVAHDNSASVKSSIVGKTRTTHGMVSHVNFAYLFIAL